ncbi:MAG TPA: outer membrane protein assembly factor BamD [Pyrinomonadaceae bacterium]|nr:outer membrane protein assembly factor BamD [Pyrinomonadaceae bacterium]
MSFLFVPKTNSRGALNLLILALAVCVLTLSIAATTFAQGSKNSIQSGQSNKQRLDVMRSKLDAMRRSLDSAIAAINAKDTGDEKKNPDDPRERLRSLDKEVGSVLSEVNDLHAKEDKSEKYDNSRLDALEDSVADLSTRVEAGLQATAGARTASSETSSNYHPKPEKGKRRLFGLLPGKSDEKYAALLTGTAPGRDRELFTEATKQVRKGSHETGRLLFTTIITTYPDSPFLPMAKLAIADSFYLEGTTSSLIQAGQAYQDWLTYFPTDALTCDAMMKVAETEMRQMGLSDRDISHARKAEQRLKVMLQTCTKTALRPDAEVRLREVQDNLAMHSLYIARFYGDRFTSSKGVKGGLKGEQSRLQEIVDKYPNFCLMDEVLFRLGWTYQQEEEPDEAAKLFQELVRDYPNSDYLDKAKDQLNIIGAAIPEPDPIRKTMPTCEKPTFMQNMMQQITGSADVTTSHDGILITRHGEGNDLIDKALANNGTLPEGIQPVIQRTKPALVPVNQPQPTTSPDTTQDKKKIGVGIQSNSNGPLPDRINPGATTTPGTRPNQTPTPKP